MRVHSYMVSASREESLPIEVEVTPGAPSQPESAHGDSVRAVVGVRHAVAVVHPDAIADLRRARAHHRRHRRLAAWTFRALERSSAAGTPVVDAAPGTRGQPV